MENNQFYKITPSIIIMPSKDHKQLVKVLNKLVKQERWRKIPKALGKVVEKSLTKSGNIRVILKGKSEVKFFVLKRNKNLFETASKLMEGDVVSVALRTQLGKQYAVKLIKKGKSLSEFIS